MTGHVNEAKSRAVAAALESAILSRDAVETFWDLGELKTYHSLARKLCTDVLLRNARRVLSIKVYAVSRVVRMGVAAANLFLKRIESYDDRAKFELALRDAVRSPRR
jgi:hypothetical protein